MKRKFPYIVHINPHFRPRDPVNIWYPFIDHITTGAALGFAMFDAMNVFFTNLMTLKK